jgi:hypothetical protein
MYARWFRFPLIAWLSVVASGGAFANSPDIQIKSASMKAVTTGAYEIAVVMDPEPTDEDKKAMADEKNWDVENSLGTAVPISEIKFTVDNQPKLYVPWDGKVVLQVSYRSQEKVSVEPLDPTKTVGLTSNLPPVRNLPCNKTRATQALEQAYRTISSSHFHLLARTIRILVTRLGDCRRLDQ